MDEVKRFFRPEFLNRLDATVVFHQLDREQIHAIVDLMINMVQKELEERNVTLEITEAPASTWAKRASTRSWAPAPCAALSRMRWRTPCPTNSSAAA